MQWNTKALACHSKQNVSLVIKVNMFSLCQDTPHSVLGVFSSPCWWKRKVSVTKLPLTPGGLLMSIPFVLRLPFQNQESLIKIQLM